MNYRTRRLFGFLALIIISLTSCGGGGGTSSSQPIVPPASPSSVDSISISPQTAKVRIYDLQQFNVSVATSGNSDKTVTWMVNDHAGGTDEFGRIESGAYHAPLTIPAGTITVKVTANGDHSKSATASVNLLPRITINTPYPYIPNSAEAQFTANVQGTSDSRVT